MAVAKASTLEALPQPKIPVTPVALVLGGGLSGMTAAIAVAESGYTAHLVEKDKELGGHLRNIHHRTLGGVDPQQTLKDLTEAVSAHENIQLHLGDQLTELKGFIGNFESTLKSGEKVK